MHLLEECPDALRILSVGDQVERMRRTELVSERLDEHRLGLERAARGR